MTFNSRALRVVVFALALSLCGCVPFVDDVFRPEGPLVKSSRSGSCVVGGGKSTHVILEAHVRVEFFPVVTGKDTHIEFAVFVPNNANVRLEGRQASLETVRGTISRPFEFRQGPLPGPTDGPGSSMNLKGGNENMYGHPYDFKIPLESAPVEEFSMTLPAMHVGEQAVEPIVIHYRRRHLAGVAPLTC